MTNTGSQPGYAWTFAFMLAMFVLIGMSWALMSSTQSFQVMWSVILVGVSVICIRTLMQVIAFDRQHLRTAAIGSQTATAIMKQHITSSCPDYYARTTDETTGATVCSNNIADVFIGDKTPKEFALSEVDELDTCTRIKNGTNEYPWLAMTKYCEYAKQPY